MSTCTIADHMEPKIPVTKESDLIRISPLRWVYGSRTPVVSRWPTDFHLAGNALISDILKIVASNLRSAEFAQLQVASAGLWQFCVHETQIRHFQDGSEFAPNDNGYDERYECDDGYDRWDELYNEDHLDDWADDY